MIISFSLIAQYLQQLNKEKELSYLQQIGEKHRQLRSSEKNTADALADQDKAMHDHQTYKSSCDLELKETVKLAKKEERGYLSKVKADAAKKAALSQRTINAHKLLIETLTERTRFAEKEASTAQQQAKQSVRRSTILSSLLASTKKMLAVALSREATLENAVQHLQDACNASSSKIKELEAMVPHKKIGKIREGRGGQSTWPLHVWELVMKQLVLGVPPSAVYQSIGSTLRQYAPGVKLVHPISIDAIRRARTVLLVIVQTLASYRLSKANKWGQIFHDATSRRQLSFQNLVISTEEDELFRYVLKTIDVFNVQIDWRLAHCCWFHLLDPFYCLAVSFLQTKSLPQSVKKYLKR